ncbi:unnamed protein product, partial [Sphacelaria rigidula]
ADPVIVSSLVCEDGVLKNEDGFPNEGTPLDEVRRAVWGILYADDAGMVSRSPVGFSRMMAVIVVVCREFEPTVSGNETAATHLVISTQLSRNGTAHPGGRPTVQAD